MVLEWLVSERGWGEPCMFLKIFDKMRSIYKSKVECNLRNSAIGINQLSPRLIDYMRS